MLGVELLAEDMVRAAGYDVDGEPPPNGRLKQRLAAHRRAQMWQAQRRGEKTGSGCESTTRGHGPGGRVPKVRMVSRHGRNRQGGGRLGGGALGQLVEECSREKGEEGCGSPAGGAQSRVQVLAHRGWCGWSGGKRKAGAAPCVDAGADWWFDGRLVRGKSSVGLKRADPLPENVRLRA